MAAGGTPLPDFQRQPPSRPQMPPLEELILSPTAPLSRPSQQRARNRTGLPASQQLQTMCRGRPPRKGVSQTQSTLAAAGRGGRPPLACSQMHQTAEKDARGAGRAGDRGQEREATSSCSGSGAASMSSGPLPRNPWLSQSPSLGGPSGGLHSALRGMDRIQLPSHLQGAEGSGPQ